MRVAIIFCMLILPLTPGWTASLEKTLEQSDALIVQKKPKEALELLVGVSDQSAQTLWRLSRAHAIVGDLLQEGSDGQKTHYEKALQIARQAVEADPKSAWAHLRVATAAGKIALFKGPLSAKGLVNEVRKASKTAISLAGADKSALAFGHLLIGRAHLKLSKTPYVIRKPLGLAWANVKEAKEHLAKAVELEPNRILNQLALAEAYAQLDDKEAALKHAKIVVSLPPAEVGDEKRIDEGKALIKKVQ